MCISTVDGNKRSTTPIVSDTNRPRGPAALPWGVVLCTLHLLAIASGTIDPLSPVATGTITVHSWFIGWIASYRRYGLTDRWVQIEAALLLCGLFQLAVGAFAFSRIYYGPWLGHSQDLFQGLTVVYARDYRQWVPDHMIEWWARSSHSRFAGLGWWVCEFADILAHQGPFALLCRILSKEACSEGVQIKTGWSVVLAAMVGIWMPLSAVAGILHRLAWDYSTCGECFCDGPYRGFLKMIQPHHQLFWHAAPCFSLVAGTLFLRRVHENQHLKCRQKRY